MAGIFAVFTTNEIKERKIEKQNKNKKEWIICKK